jgi:hydrogenase maturation protease
MAVMDLEKTLRDFLPTGHGASVVIAAVGNEMCSDDAFSFYVIRRLTELKKRDMLHPGLSLMMCAGGIDFFTERIAEMGPGRLLLVGTADFGEEPGEVRFLQGDGIDAVVKKGRSEGHGLELSPGAGDMGSFLSAFNEACPGSPVGILAVQPKSLEVGSEMEYEVMAAGDGLYEILVRLFFVE